MIEASACRIIFAKKRDEEHKAGDKKKHTAKHAPKAAYAGDAKADGRDNK